MSNLDIIAIDFFGATAKSIYEARQTGRVLKYSDIFITEAIKYAVADNSSGMEGIVRDRLSFQSYKRPFSGLLEWQKSDIASRAFLVINR
jgi:hypothetical protein